MKILHLADIHARDKDIEEIENCLCFIIETSKKEKPDLIINAGDTFDSALIRADSQTAKMVFRVFKELADIAPVAIIIGTKSHDGQTAEILRYIKAKYDVCVSTVPEQLYLCDGCLGTNPKMPGCPVDAPIEAVVSMVPAPTKEFFKSQRDILGSDSEIAAQMGIMFAGFTSQAKAYYCPHILVGHWNTTGALVSETQTLIGVDIEISRDQMALANADIILLGHLHLKQKIKPNIFYSGSITGLNYGELEDKGFYIHDFEGNKLVKSRFIQTPSKKLMKITEDLTGDLSVIKEIDTLLYSHSPDDLKDAYLRVEIKVPQDEAGNIDQEKIEAFFLSAGAKQVDVNLIKIPRENVRSQVLLQLETLREKLIEQAKLRGETVPESILGKSLLLEAESSEQVIKKTQEVCNGLDKR